MLATYDWDNAADTLVISLGDDESLTIAPSGSNATFGLSSGTFTPLGDSVGSGSSITIPTADLVSSISIHNSTVTTGTNNVTFSGAGSLTSGTISVVITDPDAVGTISFSGGFDISASTSIALTTNHDIVVGSGSEIAATGSGTIGLTADRSISSFGSSIISQNGDVTLLANSGGTTGGDFDGIWINAATVTTTGSGSVWLTGTGGSGSGTNNIGVQIDGNATVSSGGAGTVTIHGTGGSGDFGGNNGVAVSGTTTLVTSGGGHLFVTGVGGSGSGNFNRGVGIFSFGKIIGGGTTGNVTVHGTGGSGTGGSNHGVELLSASGQAGVTSGGGDVQVTGLGGNNAASGSSLGVEVDNGGLISAGGSGTVLVDGTGGASTAIFNHGVAVGITGMISSSGGLVTVTGQGGGSGPSAANTGIQISGTVTSGAGGNVIVTGSSAVSGNGVIVFGTVTSGTTGTVSITGTGGGAFGVRVDGAVTSGGGDVTVTGSTGVQGANGGDFTTAANGGNIFVVTNNLDLPTGSTIDAGAGVVTLRQFTNAFAINLGGSDTGSQLGLSDAELDRVTAGTLNIGDANSGAVSVSAIITQTGKTTNITTPLTTTVLSGGDLGMTGAVNSPLVVNTSGTVRPGSSPGIIDSGNVSFAGGSNFNVELNGTTVGTDYDQLDVTGTVTLNNGNLVVTLGYTPANGDSFTIINNDGTDAVMGAGTFRVGGTTIPDGGTFTVGGTTFVIDYTSGSDSNDVTLTAVDAGTLTATLVGGDLTITDIADVTNSLSVSVSGSDLVISDTTRTFVSAPAGGVLSNLNRTLTIPAASVTGTLTIDAAGGADTIGVGALGTTLLSSLTTNGGTADDVINLTGDVTFAADKSLLVAAETVNTGAGADLVTSGAGAIAITADDVAIDATSTLQSAGTVSFMPQTAARPIDLGTETAGSLSLTDAELDQVTAGRIDVGNASAGAVAFSSAIDLANSNTLKIITGGTINDTGGSPVFTDTSLALDAAAGVGRTSTLNVAVSNLAATVAAGGVDITNTGNVVLTTVGGVVGVSATNSNVSIAAASSITVSQPVSATGSGAILLDAQGGDTGDLFIQNSLTTAGGGISLIADDDILANPSGTIATTSGAVLVKADDDAGGSTAGPISYEADVNHGSAGSTWSLTENGAAFGVISGSGGLTKLGGSLLSLENSANSYTGTTLVNEGTLQAKRNGALGTTAGGTFVAPGAVLSFANVNYSTPEPVTSNGGAIMDDFPSSFTGPITLTADSFFLAVDSLTLSGQITGGFGFTKQGGGVLILTNPANDYGGGTTVAGGTLRLGAAGVVPDTSDVDVQPSTMLDLNGFSETIDGLIGGGAVTSGGAGAVTLTVGANHQTADNFEGTIQNGAGTVGLTKTGSGVQTLSGTNTYTGATAVNAGILRINAPGSLADGSAVSINGGTLGGTGTVNGPVSMTASGGSIAPGTSPGILTVDDNVSFASAGSFAVELNGTTVGTQYDQLRVTGAGRTVTLADATLDVTISGFTPVNGDTFTIIHNVDATSTINGTFDGLAEGAALTIGGTDFRITYAGGTDSNDVVLTADTVAPSATSFTRKAPAGSPTNADTLVFLATFSEGVTGVAAADFAATGTTGTISVAQVTSSTYDVTISGGDLAGLNGTVGLNFNSPTITDLAGNALPNSEPAIDETYLVDNTATSSEWLLDFDAGSGVTAPGYVGVPLLQRYGAGGADYGWDGAAPALADFDRATSDALTRDGHYGYDATFLVDLPAGEYLVNPVIGDASPFYHDQFQVFAEGAATPQVTVNTTAGQWSSPVFAVTVHDGQLALRLRDAGGPDPHFVINGLRIRPQPASPIALQRLDPDGSGPLDADGASTDLFQGTGAPAFSWLTVATTLGSVRAGQDGDALLQGVQVQADGEGVFTFQIQRPSGTGEAGNATATITAQEVLGRNLGATPQEYQPAQTSETLLRFDFNASATYTQDGFTGVGPRDLYTGTRGYGWSTRVAAADRNPGGSWSNLNRDLHTGSNATFRLQVGAGSYNVRVYLPNPLGNGTYAYTYDNFDVIVEGSSKTASVATLTPGVIRIEEFTGAEAGRDTNGDGVLDIQFVDRGGQNFNWVVSGIELSAGSLGTAVNYLTAAKAGPTAMGNGVTIDEALLKPVVAEAVARWTATGLTPAQAAILSDLHVGVSDLGGATLGLAYPTTNEIWIDEDAAGWGWGVERSAISGQRSAGGAHGTDWETWRSNVAAGSGDPRRALSGDPRRALSGDPRRTLSFLNPEPRTLNPPADPRTLNPGMDLLSAVMHEMGHLLGYEHSEDPDDLMSPVLGASLLRPPVPGSRLWTLDSGLSTPGRSAEAVEPLGQAQWRRGVDAWFTDLAADKPTSRGTRRLPCP